MFRDTLKEQQPVVYQTLENALVRHKLAHAYMFSGPSGTMKKETAYLFAQSLLCDQEGFACEECDTCQRIAHNEYADMMYLDGTSISIKKDDILKLQKEFNKTGLERQGTKVYILDHVENATVDALNSLLKFLEEPANDMIAILIVEQLERVLPTIISRCQNIPFRSMNTQQCYEAVKNEIDQFDAYMLSSMIRQKGDILEASEHEDYQHARYVFKEMLKRYTQSPYDALLFLQLEGFPAKQKKYGKEALQYVLDMLHIFFKDCMKNNIEDKEPWYLEQIKQMQKLPIDYIAMLQICMNAKDKLLRSVNIPLLVDQIVYEMKEVTK